MDFNTHKKYAKLDDGIDDSKNMGVVVMNQEPKTIEKEKKAYAYLGAGCAGCADGGTGAGDICVFPPCAAGYDERLPAASGHSDPAHPAASDPAGAD